jgi:hypothetical protein
VKRGAFVFIIVFPALIFGAIVFAQEPGEYIWPVKDKIEVTGVFCDMRTGHPHGGIDISHFGKIGTVPIVSVADGVLMRIRSSKYGYGNALYIRMAGKRVAVYAHLDSFTPRLQKLGEQLRRQTGQTRLDYYYEPWEMNVPIKKGEVIGYGGNTGTSSAHLHFELRHDDLTNLNPLTNGLVLPDSISPTIRSILFVPVGPNATVAGKDRSKIVRLSRSGRPLGLNGPMQVTGRVGLAVDALDSHRAGGRSFAPYRITVLVDGELFFEARYDTWSYIDQRVWTTQHDFDQSRTKRFFRAYNPYPVEIPFFSEPDAGTFERLSPGEHPVRIIAADASGNESSAEFIILVDPGPNPKARHWPRGSGDLLLFNDKSAGSEQFSVVGNPFSFFEPIRLNIRPSGKSCYEATNTGVFLRQPVGLQFGLPQSDPDPLSYGIYARGEKGLEFIGGKYAPGISTVTGETLKLGTFCLRADIEKPVISNLRIAPGRSRLATFTVSDDLAGLARDAVHATVDGKLALVQFQTNTGRASANTYWTLDPGVHELIVYAEDNSGNVSVVKKSFTSK